MYTQKPSDLYIHGHYIHAHHDDKRSYPPLHVFQAPARPNACPGSPWPLCPGGLESRCFFPILFWMVSSFKGGGWYIAVILFLPGKVGWWNMWRRWLQERFWGGQNRPFWNGWCGLDFHRFHGISIFFVHKGRLMTDQFSQKVIANEAKLHGCLVHSRIPCLKMGTSRVWFCKPKPNNLQEVVQCLWVDT